ncbi:MAG: hypothetical protein ACOY5C_03860 [Pseudomonadota bacterium]|uniref:hypothetical protein n=1 Tax=Thermithiobacillus tepidarius TaxID=929 RepID=UPI0004107239|nr:hypothetical protein [Thermithiobacillus tepidarius]
MALSHNQRRIALGLALAATLVATVWANQQEDAGDANARASRPASGQAPREVRLARTPEAPVDALQLDKLQRAVELGDVDDVFASKSWAPPPKVAPAPQLPPPPPPPPAPPPLPFTYLGKLLDDGETTVFLSFQDRNLAVKTGDVIDSLYRVDEIRPQALTVTYLPMDAKQTLYLGDRT